MISGLVGERSAPGQGIGIPPDHAGDVMKDVDAYRFDAVRASGTGTPDEGAAGQETN
ncbi:hypothetical protein JNN96_30590 [Mycobacterium sp. DSM 3803]|nr:hypothetical protein [Mycobacterium sp. DSM 3803]